ncbi:MAG: DUF1800 family protein, partial [Candidatus Kapaibacterium sp.]
MDRRSFLTGWAKRGVLSAPADNLSSSHNQPLSTGLEPWVPTTTDQWDEVRAGHLLRRTMMMPTWSDLAKIVVMTPSDAVDLLMNTPSNPKPIDFTPLGPEWDSSLGKLDVQLTSQMKAKWAAQDALLKNWFANVLLSSPISIVEKLTLFWSGHFTSQFDASDSYVLAPSLYRQNVLFRNNGLLNFKDLAFYVTLDGAMIVYLGGDQNFIGKPNENYSRELME